MTEWTEARAYEVLRAALTDAVMKQERIRVYRAVRARARELMAALGVSELMDQPETVERLDLYQEFHHVPGDHLWQAMQFVFRVARDGGDAEDARWKSHYTNIIYNTLFCAPFHGVPKIPDQWWETPLGVCCKVVQDGIASCEALIREMDEEATP